MTTRKYIQLFLSVSLLVVGCKKSFLDVPDKKTLLLQPYVTDLKTTGEFLNGIYVELASKFHQGPTTIYMEVIADDMKPNLSVLTNPYSWNQTASNDNSTVPDFNGVNANGIWTSGHRIIRDCNLILQTIGKYRNEDEAKADNYKGQAYAIRAYMYWFIINAFRQSYNFTASGSHTGIPYITTYDWRQVGESKTVADVYTNIINDLNQAIELLPVSQTVPTNFPKTILFNRYATQALLARVYLFKEDYRAAKDLARAVISAVPIMTGTNYPSKLFTAQETEALFQLPPSQTNIAGSPGAYITQYPALNYPPGWFLATNDIANVLRESAQDKRKAWVSGSAGTWKISKFPTNVITGFSSPEASYYLTLLRSSEMYLTASECYARLNNEDSARYFLDAIRIRANLNPLSTATTGVALLDSVYKERRRELAFEGFRMFDLLRWKKGVNRLDANAGAPQNLIYPSNKAIAPIPLQDVQLSGIPQNDGY